MTEQTSPASSLALSLDLIITCADGLEAPLQTELTSFGIASEIKSTGALPSPERCGTYTRFVFGRGWPRGY